MKPRNFPPPEPGDIVWCRFPQFAGISPGPKSRPVLVLAVDDRQAPARVRVAYGTSRGIHEVAPWEFAISADDGEPYRMAGLSHATKFSMRTVVVLDYTALWFTVAPAPAPIATPKMGVLHPRLVRRAQEAYQAAQRNLEK